MNEEGIRAKLIVSYRFDQYLMYLVQDTTQRPAAEIVNFFYELTNQVCTIGLEKKKGSGIRKNISDYFPGTSIPFHMLVTGTKSHSRWNPVSRTYEEGEHFSCTAEVGFPESRTYMKEDDLKSIATGLMEKALGFGEDVVIPDFKKPEIKTPKIYQDLMDSFAGRPKAEKPPRKRKARKSVECVFCGYDNCTGCTAGGAI